MIEVRDGRFGKGVYAVEPIRPGRLILRGWGERVPKRTRHSFQVDHDTHIEIRTPIELINHSCEPNCGVLVRRDERVMEIHALTAIGPGEELFTDYASFEYEIEFMGEPCRCGTASCRVEITGYRDLPGHRRARYEPYIADYLREIEAETLQPART